VVVFGHRTSGKAREKISPEKKTGKAANGAAIKF
jgi:hypothetical protein